MRDTLPRLSREQAVDAAVAAVIFVPVAAIAIAGMLRDPDVGWPRSLVEMLLIVVACGLLYWRRRKPVLVCVLVFGATAAYYLTSSLDGPLLLALVVALYSVAEQGLLEAAASLAALVLLATFAGTLAGNDDFNAVALFMLAGWLVAIVALGWVRYSRLAYAREVERRAADAERLRIARELHDAIGHHLSAINVQAASALHRGGGDRPREALSAIKASSGEALHELRTMLGVLRRGEESAPTAPEAGLARIDDLVRAAAASGLAVDVEVSGDGELPMEVDLAVYRIVQESLTNITRHSGATTVGVRLDRARGEVRVEVVDDGRGRAGDGAGSGIRGMTERAEALGGDLTAGPEPGGGFAVRARLPYAQDRLLR